jgi:Ca2+-binding RTX toxin-like protein
VINILCVWVGDDGGDVINGWLSHAYQIWTFDNVLLLIGGTGDDVIYGNNGNDVLNGQAGDDRVYGNGGDDRIFGGAGDDYLDGGSDDDYIAGTLLLLCVVSSMHMRAWLTTFSVGGAGDDDIYGRGDNDELKGQAGDDFIQGNGGSDDIDGGDGEDRLYGNGGADYIEGNVNRTQTSFLIVATDGRRSRLRCCVWWHCGRRCRV